MKQELVVVVPDGGIEQAMRGIVARHESIGIHPLRNIKFIKIPNRDPGVFESAHEFASAFRNTHEHALVLLDLNWDGAPTTDRVEMARQIERRLAPDWRSNGRCVVIDPELEVWVWSDSPHVASQLGWPSWRELRNWLGAENLWPQGRRKPTEPKKALKRALNQTKTPLSNAIFYELAWKVSLRRCSDQSFAELVEILRGWFSS